MAQPCQVQLNSLCRSAHVVTDGTDHKAFLLLVISKHKHLGRNMMTFFYLWAAEQPEQDTALFSVKDEY